jgi:hypothetical protein
MSLKTENEARLGELHTSLNRIACERSRCAPGNTAWGILTCKEEDTRLQIFELELIVQRHADAEKGVRAAGPCG